MPLRRKKHINRYQFVDLISAEVADKTITKAQIDEILVLAMEVIQRVANTDSEIVMRPWGKFHQKTRQARTYTDPHGKKVSKPGKVVVAWTPFRAGKKEL